MLVLSHYIRKYVPIQCMIGGKSSFSVTYQMLMPFLLTLCLILPSDAHKAVFLTWVYLQSCAVVYSGLLVHVRATQGKLTDST